MGPSGREYCFRVDANIWAAHHDQETRREAFERKPRLDSNLFFVVEIGNHKGHKGTRRKCTAALAAPVTGIMARIAAPEEFI